MNAHQVYGRSREEVQYSVRMPVAKNLTYIYRLGCSSWCARTSRCHSGSAKLAVVGSGPAGFYTTLALLEVLIVQLIILLSVIYAAK